MPIYVFKGTLPVELTVTAPDPETAKHIALDAPLAASRDTDVTHKWQARGPIYGITSPKIVPEFINSLLLDLPDGSAEQFDYETAEEASAGYDRVLCNAVIMFRRAGIERVVTRYDGQVTRVDQAFADAHPEMNEHQLDTLYGI